MTEKQTRKTAKVEKKAKPAKGAKEKKPKQAKVEKKVQVKKAEKKIETKTPEKITQIIPIRPLITEKAVMLIESQNTLTVEAPIRVSRSEIKKEVEDIFNVKVDKIRTLVKKGKKYAYVKLNPKHLAMDVATKLGMI